MNNRIISASDMINAAFASIDKSDIEKNNRLFSAWKKTLLKMDEGKETYNGQGIFSHAKILDVKNGILFVEVDHPGWGELLKLHQKFIVNGLNFDKEVKNLGIKSIAFKLAGSKANVSERELDSYKAALQKKMQQDADKQQKFYEENLPPRPTTTDSTTGDPTTEKKELPPEMLAMFERMRKLV